MVQFFNFFFFSFFFTPNTSILIKWVQTLSLNRIIRPGTPNTQINWKSAGAPNTTQLIGMVSVPPINLGARHVLNTKKLIGSQSYTWN